VCSWSKDGSSSSISSSSQHFDIAANTITHSLSAPAAYNQWKRPLPAGPDHAHNHGTRSIQTLAWHSVPPPPPPRVQGHDSQAMPASLAVHELCPGQTLRTCACAVDVSMKMHIAVSAWVFVPVCFAQAQCAASGGCCRLACRSGVCHGIVRAWG
jgi:hypothetical protein